MGKTIIATVITVLVSSLCFCQNLETRRHLLGGSATISPGFQQSNPDMNIYVHGFAYFYPEPKVSLNGEVYWYTGAQEQETLLAENSTLVFGPNYHFLKDGPLDPHIGIMPAISLVSAIDRTTSQPSVGAYSLVPLVALNAGVRYHFMKWFNVFANARYMMGTLTENYPKALSMNEWRISFGLGFNVYSSKE
ncbi:hypothetical protein [Parvicella tangerina]|uniref:Outer membrane protein beta-barrel domain-containing protein n=1 Tax=Parvicella tangerina TaxID=2829795 RepID=A0A916NJM6_9FLAO|nr:hypothetical protein [Parvicella tangerina]CAG5087099.1 hypothetical protein CRYO30217_03388 [Parvicella tangerina]